MDMDFTPEELAFQADVRSFLNTALTGRLIDGARRTPGVFVEPDIGLEWQRILHEKGWLATHWPVEDGGTGWTPVQRYIFEKECALAGAPSLPVLGLKLVGPVICRFGTPEQKARFLPRILSAEDYWCQGYSEPGSGSDLASLKTRARLDGDQYRINGSKIWTTHAHYANWIFCLVRTDAEVSAQRGITFLLVPMDQPGITVTPIITMAGDHEVNQVFFDDATSSSRQPHRRRRPGLDHRQVPARERARRIVLCAQADRRHRPADRQPQAPCPAAPTAQSAHDPVIARKLASLRLRARAFEITELRILAEIAKGRPPGPQTSMVKLFSANLRQELDTLAMELHGLDGLQLPAERPLYGNEAPEPVGSVDAQMAAGRYLNSRAWTIFGGSDEVQKNIIAKTVLGL